MKRLLYIVIALLSPLLMALADSSGLVTCSTPATTCTAVTQICSNASVVCSNPTYTCRQVCAPTPAPTPPAAPAAGYSAWFDANELTTLFQDAAGTVPVVANANPVRRWVSKDGTAVGYYASQAAGVSPPIYSDAVPSIASDVTRDFVFAGAAVIANGIVTANAYTVFTVASWDSADDKSAVGTATTFMAEQRNQPGHIEISMYDGAGNAPALAGDFSGAFVIVTSLLGGGNGSVGVNDTRTASMSTPVVFTDQADTLLNLFGALGSRYLNGDLAEVIFYPTALSEADRQTTEQYLATKYGITLPY